MIQQTIERLAQLGFRTIKHGERYVVIQAEGGMMSLKPIDEAGLVELARVIVSVFGDALDEHTESP